MQEYEDSEVSINSIEKLAGSTEKIIILLDINQPALNGWDFLDKLQQNNNYNIQHLAVYIVSSSIDKSDLLKAENYDMMKKFILKPIDIDIIASILIIK